MTFVDKVRSSKPFSLLDVIVLAVAVALVIALAIATFIKPEANTVEIVAPDFYGQYSLKDEQIVEVNGVVVQISEGKVRVLRSTCKNGQCTPFGSIDKTGQVIVCSPNAVVIRITSKDGLDGEVG